jgi:predicted membrane protein
MTSERPFSMGRLLSGVLLVVLGVLWLVEEFTDLHIAWASVLPVILILIGVGLMFGAATGSHGGLITLGIFITILVVLSSAVEVLVDVPFRGGVGDHQESPATLEAEYRWAVGSMRIDLTDVVDLTGTTELSVGIGELVVIVPNGVTVWVEADGGLGEVVVFGQTQSGISPETTYGSEGAELHIIARIGIGKVEVKRG